MCVCVLVRETVLLCSMLCIIELALAHAHEAHAEKLYIFLFLILISIPQFHVECITDRMLLLVFSMVDLKLYKFLGMPFYEKVHKW
jgi:hypothetical protein